VFVFQPNILPFYRDLQNRKMKPPGGFKLIGPAVEGLLKGQWAFLVADTILYPLVRAATPQQRCRMFEVSDVPKMQIPLCTPISRESPIINMLNRA